MIPRSSSFHLFHKKSMKNALLRKGDKMKKTKYRIILFGIVILLMMSMNGILIYAISDLQSSIKQLTKKIEKNKTEVENQIANISDTFEKTLQEQNRYISSFEFLYGDMNVETGKIALTVKVIPKESRQDTTLLVTYEEDEGTYHTVNTKRMADNLYEANFQIPYNKDYHIGVLIKENKRTKQEYLDWIYDIESQMQLQVTGAYLDGNYSLDPNGILKVSGKIHLDLFNPSDSQEILGVTDNYIKEVKACLYVDGIKQSEAFMIQDENISSGNEYVCEIDEKVNLFEGQQFQLAVEITDSLGFYYKTYAILGTAQPNAELDTDDYNYGYVEITP